MGLSIGGFSNPYTNAFSIGNNAGGNSMGVSGAQGDLRLDGTAKAERPKLPGIKDPNAECETCKRRKYQDGSDEMVSFKTPAHISPQASASAVRSHEQEHVTNAYSSAATRGGKVLSATVSLHTAVCPECGRSYVSGGTTRTQIRYGDEKNPYQQDLKGKDAAKYRGINLDKAI